MVSFELSEAAKAVAQAVQAIAAGARVTGAVQASCCLVAAAKAVLAGAKLMRPALGVVWWRLSRRDLVRFGLC